MQRINCAVYVRKSTEHGLEQEFNSLNNQEEACKAYILSQAFNGWEYYKTFSDGGISGGTMDRPGLQEMLAEIRQGNIQVVIVYKVDRLSRSIIDFHKMMQEFNKHNCNFVSITQSFDTSNSMGKLTLNMLLSFAQFEREVSAERVRDKISASKAKGMWMGGNKILGYDIVNKQLSPNEREVNSVNIIFNKYLELGNLSETCIWLKREGYLTKSWESKKGSIVGGREISISYLHRTLTNQVYIGKIPYYATKQVFDGKHKGIVPIELFNKVQEHLKRNIHNKQARHNYIKDNTLLAGLLYDEKGNKYNLTSNVRNNIKTRYYHNKSGVYIPLEQLNNFVMATIKSTDFREIEKYGDITLITVSELKLAIKRVICERVKRDCYLTILLNKQIIMEYLTKHRSNTESKHGILIKPDMDINKDEIVIKTLFVLDSYTSVRLRNTCANNILSINELNESLVKGISRGWQLKKMLEKGLNTRELEKASKLDKRTFCRYINLCYLSPSIIEDIFDYKNPRHMGLRELMDIASQEITFAEQETLWANTTNN